LTRESAFNPQLTRFNAFSNFKLAVSAFVSYGVSSDQRADATATRHPVDLSIELGSDPEQHREPLVSCLMVTRNRLRQAQIAIQCFRRQTWRRRQLVVVDTSEDDGLARWVESLGDHRISFIFMPGCMDTLGDMRNFSVRAAAGTHVCQWDDDDLYHPARLEAQIAVLKATGAEVSVLLRETMWMPSWHGLSITRRRAHENTLLCRKSVLPPYPSLAKLEDTPVLKALTGTQTVAYLDQPELYIYVVHGANTWDEDHMRGIWRNSSHHFWGESYSAAMTQLARSYPLGECKNLFPDVGHVRPSWAE
jgi:hypothetical protein